MKTAETPIPPRSAPASLPEVPLGQSALVIGRGRSKILARHWAKLAVVSVRQSSLQQVLENRESTARQYALHDYAVARGWPAARVVIIDEDQAQSGASAQHRHGCQRLLAEVTMHHVGLVLGLEMSRLARRSKDWHHVLEVCALFGTLLADQAGLFHSLVRHHIWLPVRARTGSQQGQLPWRRPSLATLAQVLHHPIYAGASTSGRRPVDPQGAYTGHSARHRKWVSMDQWAVLIQDHLPASITWDHYLKNQERLTQHQSAPDTMGAPREGVALLAGVFVCGTCGRRMHVSSRRTHQPSSHGLRHFVEATEPSCPGVQAAVLDTCVAQQVLRALEPAA